MSPVEEPGWTERTCAYELSMTTGGDVAIPREIADPAGMVRRTRIRVLIVGANTADKTHAVADKIEAAGEIVPAVGAEGGSEVGEPHQMLVKA